MSSAISVDADGWYNAIPSESTDITSNIIVPSGPAAAEIVESINVITAKVEEIDLATVEGEAKVEHDKEEEKAEIKDSIDPAGIESTSTLSAEIENSDPSNSAREASKSAEAPESTTRPPPHQATAIRARKPPSNPSKITPRTSLTSRYAPATPNTSGTPERAPLLPQEDAFRLSPVGVSESNVARGAGKWPTRSAHSPSQHAPSSNTSTPPRAPSTAQQKSLPPHLAQPAISNSLGTPSRSSTRPLKAGRASTGASKWATTSPSTQSSIPAPSIATLDWSDPDNSALRVDGSSATTPVEPLVPVSLDWSDEKNSASWVDGEISSGAKVSLWIEDEVPAPASTSSPTFQRNEASTRTTTSKESISRYANKPPRSPTQTRSPQLAPTSSPVQSQRKSAQIITPDSNAAIELDSSTSETIVPVRREMPNRNRIATGGIKKKISPEELDEKMRIMREKNEALQARADAVNEERIVEERLARSEAAALELMRETERIEEEQKIERIKREKERVRLEATEKKTRNNALQNKINEERRITAEKKLSRVSGREWDSEKLKPASELTDALYPSQQSTPFRAPSMGALDKGVERTSGGYDQVIQDEELTPEAAVEPIE